MTLRIDKFLTAKGDYEVPPKDGGHPIWLGDKDSLDVVFYEAYLSLDFRYFFCTCGTPATVCDFVYRVLRALSGNFDGRPEEWKAWYEAYDRGLDAVLPDRGTRYFVFYTLDLLGLTDHGTFVPGWPSQKGLDFMADYEELARLGVWEEAL